MKKLKTTIALLLSVIITISTASCISPQKAHAAKLSYTYDKSAHTLYVNGSGKMKKNDKPWDDDYRVFGSVKKIVIQRGITSIAAYAFSDDIDGNSGTGRNGLNNVTEIVIPDTVKSIGEEAFSFLFKLKKISIPRSVTKVGKRAFADCQSLKSITIHSTLKKLSEEMFYNCDSLRKVKIEKGVKEIGVNAFDCCTKLTSLKLPRLSLK